LMGMFAMSGALARQIPMRFEIISLNQRVVGIARVDSRTPKAKMRDALRAAHLLVRQ